MDSYPRTNWMLKLHVFVSGLRTGLLSGGINKGEMLETDSIYTNMINAIEYRNAKAMVSI